MRSCHWLVKESHVKYIATNSSPISCCCAKHRTRKHHDKHRTCISQCLKRLTAAACVHIGQASSFKSVLTELAVQCQDWVQRKSLRSWKQQQHSDDSLSVWKWPSKSTHTIHELWRHSCYNLLALLLLRCNCIVYRFRWCTCVSLPAVSALAVLSLKLNILTPSVIPTASTYSIL
jgi:hypothetical protein